MDLIPEELRTKIPQLEEASAEPDPLVWMKLSVPEAGWTGYVIALSQPVRYYVADTDFPNTFSGA